jgi:hypothetical protein
MSILIQLQPFYPSHCLCIINLPVRNLIAAALYNDKIPTELSDRLMFTNPVAVSRLSSAKVFHAMARNEPERYKALEQAGFKVDPFGDIQHAINIRLGGHYIDVGTSAKIGKGLVCSSSLPATSIVASEIYY